MRRFGRAVLSLLTICFMIVFTANVSFAESSTDNIKIENPVTIGKVALKDGVTAEVNNLMIAPLDGKQVIGLTLTVKNNSNSDLNFLDYWINLYTKSGTKLNVQMVALDSNTIPAKTTQDVQFYSYVGTNIKITDLVIKVIKWDFSVANYTKVLGQITIPERYNQVTPAGSGRLVQTGNVKAGFIVKSATIGKSEKYYRPDLRIVIRNTGKSTITLPDYQLYIQTGDNLLYPLTVSNLKGTTLNALTEEEFQLSTSIPISVKTGNWKLVVMYPINDNKEQLPAASFQLPSANVGQASDLNKFYTFSNSEGVYYIKLNSLNRLPIEDNDLIVANVTLANKGNETLPIPDLTGKFTFNDTIEKTVTISQNQKVIALQPGATMDLQIVGTVPYTFDISKVSLLVQEKDSEDQTQVNDLVEFTSDGSFADIPSVAGTTGFKINDVGYRSDVKIRNLFTYSGSNADILAAQITLTNEEKRLSEIQQLAGYFEKSDGTVYPVTFQTISDKLNPNGTAIIYAWASVPKDVGVSDMKLVVGKAITEKSTDSSGNSNTVVTGYVAPYKMDLPAEKAAQESLQKIDLIPYTLSITRVGTAVNYQVPWLKLNFDYDLEQDLLTKANLSDQKIVVEIVDSDESIKFSKELTISDKNTSTTLTTGKNTIELDAWNDDDLVNIHTTNEFTLNIYQEFQTGYKKLIATQKIPWLVNRTFSE